MVADARQAFVERDRKLDFKAKTKSISSNNHGTTMEDLTRVWKTGWPSSAENDKNFRTRSSRWWRTTSRCRGRPTLGSRRPSSGATAARSSSRRPDQPGNQRQQEFVLECSQLSYLTSPVHFLRQAWQFWFNVWFDRGNQLPAVKTFAWPVFHWRGQLSQFS